MKALTVVTHSEADMVLLAQACHKAWHTKHFMCWLTGDLGAGKTTFVRAYLRAEGVSGAIKSPTFGMIERYAVGLHGVMHMDLYRLTDPESLWALDMPELIEKHTCFVEWPSLLKSIGMRPSIDMVLTVITGGRHQIDITAAPEWLENIPDRF